MIEKSICCHYKVLESENELDDHYVSLLNRAKNNTANSYAPYSKFNVGACILLENGEMIDGSNHENAAFPMCLCAEQVAVANYHNLKSKEKIICMAISADSKDKIINTPVPPCGACRQILFELTEILNQDFKIILQGFSGPIYIIESVRSLLPVSFDSSIL